MGGLHIYVMLWNAKTVYLEDMHRLQIDQVIRQIPPELSGLDQVSANMDPIDITHVLSGKEQGFPNKSMLQDYLRPFIESAILQWGMFLCQRMPLGNNWQERHFG